MIQWKETRWEDEAKFDVLMTKLNQQTNKEPTMREIGYMQAQGAMIVDPAFPVESAN